MSSFDKELLSKLNLYYEKIEIDRKEYYPKDIISTKGRKSVVWQVSDKYNNRYALKLATYEDYIDRSFQEEMLKASKVNTYKHFARIEGAEIKIININKKDIKCIAFIEEYIKGVCLNDIENELVTVPFFIEYVKKLAEILNILKILKLRHDDLHPGNVLIVKPEAGLLYETLDVKIIDLGSIKDLDSPLKSIKKGLDDTRNFTLHLKELLNKLLFLNNGNRRILSNKEIKFREDSIEILNSIVDNDKLRALTKPYLIHKEFQSLYKRIFAPSSKTKLQLYDPFDYIAAEQISDDELLIKLFADSCPWIKDIISPNPILLTGPRGCEKSMLLRRYSLKALLSVNDSLIDEMQIIGFYISCSAELSNRLSIFTSNAHVNELREEIIHYFNLILLKEIFVTLKIIIERPDCFDKFGINIDIQQEIFHFVLNRLKITAERRLSLQGVQPIVHLLELIRYESNCTYSNLVKKSKLSNFTTSSFLSEVTKFLSVKIPYFSTKKIAFFVDDYSLHRIPSYVQPLLNMVIWDRQSSHIFKVSSEKYGINRELYNNTSADLTREYTEVDIGRSYINLSESNKLIKRFSADLLNHRLKLSKYLGTSESLIGNSKYSEGTLGRQIRSKNNNNEFYHGIDTISQICSGDISTYLEIIRTIFNNSNTSQSSIKKIPPHIQHSSIVSSSRSFLELTKTFHPYGYEMYNIVLNFGNLCKLILVEGKMQFVSKYRLYLPNETSRIEIEETELPEQLSSTLESIYKELVRRAIFIEMEPSRGRHTLGITNRLQLRRIYCPSFGISLSKNTAIKWSQSEFKAFLNDPKNKCEIEFEARWKKENYNQQTIF